VGGKGEREEMVKNKYGVKTSRMDEEEFEEFRKTPPKKTKKTFTSKLKKFGKQAAKGISEAKKDIEAVQSGMGKRKESRRKSGVRKLKSQLEEETLKAKIRQQRQKAWDKRREQSPAPDPFFGGETRPRSKKKKQRREGFGDMLGDII